MKTNLDFLDLPKYISGTHHGRPRDAPFVASENAGTVRLLSHPQPRYVEPNVRTVQEVEAKGIELCQSNAVGFLRLICAGITGNKDVYMSAIEVFGKVFNRANVKFSKPDPNSQTPNWLINSIRVHSYLLRTYPEMKMCLLNAGCWYAVTILVNGKPFNRFTGFLGRVLTRFHPTDYDMNVGCILACLSQVIQATYDVGRLRQFLDKPKSLRQR